MLEDIVSKLTSCACPPLTGSRCRYNFCVQLKFIVANVHLCLVTGLYLIMHTAELCESYLGNLRKYES